ncbi:MAG: polyphosphate polymerase domain-containing protein [Bacteroidaceae bacterium]|nr:polyphosphate polymerase domain-containing protein [Bacteroidaceae bacterium]
MHSVKLMNRTDTKFVTTMRQLKSLLEMARSQYYAQEIDGVRASNYHTLYFDTGDTAMYRNHHNGHLTRQKVRIRTYSDSQQHFLEVKTKNNHRRTKKKRVETEYDDNAITDHTDFLEKYLWLDSNLLMPVIENKFRRITLVNKGLTERLTIDFDLEFRSVSNGRQVKLDKIVIIELKRDGLKPSPVLAMLNRLRIQPMGFSKYCMGMAMCNPDLKQNRFKPRLHRIEKLQSWN